MREEDRREGRGSARADQREIGEEGARRYRHEAGMGSKKAGGGAEQEQDEAST